MKVKFHIIDLAEPIELEISKEHPYGNVQYRFKHQNYLGFQFDDYFRPTDYRVEDRVGKFFRGYLIGKKGVTPCECRMEILDASPIKM